MVFMIWTPFSGWLDYTVPTANLVGEWKLDGDVLDSSGNGNNGSATSVTYTTPSGSSIEVGVFNGSTSNVSISGTDLQNIGWDFSASIWIYWNGDGQDYETVISRGTWNTAGDWNIRKGGTTASGIKTPSYDLYTPAAPRGVLNSTIDVFEDVWHHVVATYEASSKDGKVYIDGTLHKTVTQSTDWSSTRAANTYIGRRNGSDRAFNWWLSLVRVYDATLDSDDVDNLYLEWQDLLWL